MSYGRSNTKRPFVFIHTNSEAVRIDGRSSSFEHMYYSYAFCNVTTNIVDSVDSTVSTALIESYCAYFSLKRIKRINETSKVKSSG